MKNFKIGDVVRLKGCRKWMTVIDIGINGERIIVRVVWYNTCTCEYSYASFPDKILTRHWL